MQGVSETLRNDPDLQGPVWCWEKREVWPNFLFALTGRDNTSQQQLSKVRGGWEDGEGKRGLIKTELRREFLRHVLTFYFHFTRL